MSTTSVGMKFWKVCLPEDLSDPDNWSTTFGASGRDAALSHFKYLVERDPCIEETDLTVWPEVGGPARTYRLRAARVLTFSAEEMEIVDA